MNKDQVKGRIKVAAGKAKQVAGKVAGSRRLEVKGVAEKVVGKAQAGFGDLKSELKAGLKTGLKKAR